MTLKQLDPKAHEIIEHGIHSHEVWRDYLKANPDYPTNDVGNVERHEKWLADYTYIRGALTAALRVVDAVQKAKKHGVNPHPKGLIADQRRLKKAWAAVDKALDAMSEKGTGADDG